MKRFSLIIMLVAFSSLAMAQGSPALQDNIGKQARPMTMASAYSKKPVWQKKAEKPVRQHKPGIAFRDAAGVQSVAKADKKTSQKVAAQRTVTTPFAVGNRSLRSKAVVAEGETVDEYGIIVAPAEGVRKVYDRSGYAYVNVDEFGIVEQDGQVQIVECEDGTCYIRNILYSYPTGTWVKGTREGNILTIPSKQPVYYNALASVTFSIRWGNCEDEIFFSNYDSYAEDFTFVIDDEAGTITLQNSSSAAFMGLFWDDDLTFAWHGDYETVWTYAGEYVPLSTTTVTPPAGLATETWYTKGHTLEGDQTLPFRDDITIGFDGQDIYLQGMFAEYPEAWMKGTIDGETVTFTGLQLQGEADGETVYAVGSDNSDLVNFQMTYDAEQKILVSQNALLANTSVTDIEAKTWIKDITIQLTNPYAPIETLPYLNSFDTAEEWEWFTVLDANEDNKTWKQEEGEAVYTYNEEQAADDWLFSPAIKLEAGKSYNLSLKAHCSSAYFAERVEVKMGKDMAAESMTETVVEATDVDWEDAQALGNKFVTVGETGTYYFGIHAISDADRASLKVDDFMLEETVLTAPAAVTDLTVTAAEEKPIATLTFTTPVNSIGGETLTGNMTVDILRQGEVIKTFEDVAPGTTLTYVDEDPALTAGEYRYQVMCTNADGKGDMSEAVIVRLFMVMEIPYVADFTQDAVGNQFTQIDANEDYFRWEWDGGTHATYSYNSNSSADDYLVSPPLHLDAGKRYNIIVNAGSAGYPERFEVVVGREATVEGLSTKVLEDCVVEMEDAKDFEATYAAAETGVYYVAVHCISEADMYELWINKVTVEFAPEPTAPAAPTLTVTAGAMGAMSADVVIVAPSTSVDGNSLTANISTLELYRNGTLIATFEDVAPGATINYTDNDFEEAGDYSYQVIPYNADGVGMKSEILSVYVGQDAPANITGLKAEAKQTTVLLTWDKTTEIGRNGGYVNPDEVEYVVYGCEPGTTILNSEPIAIVKDNFYEIDFNPNEGEQLYMTWCVAARNEVGESYLEDEALVQVFVGEPYDLPVIEGFADGSFHYYCDYVGTPLIYSYSSDEDGVALAMVSQEAGEVALTSGKLNLKAAANPTIIFDALGFGVSSVSVIGTYDGKEAEVLGSASLNGQGYETVKVPLTSFKEGDFAMIGIVANIENPTIFDFWTGEIETQGDVLIIDNIRVVDLFQHNLSVEMSAPATVKAGRAAKVSTTVTNWGEQAAQNYTVIITAGEKELLNQTVTEALAPFQKAKFSTEFSTSIFDEPGSVALNVKVDYSADEKNDDNAAETTIEIVNSDAPAPENLEAINQGNGVVDLSWTAPTMAAIEYTESFEDTDAFPTFSVGSITDTEHNGTFGEWTVYDSTGLGVYSWSSAGVSYDNQYAPSAWMPFDIVKAGFTDEDSAFEGNQFMLSICIVPEGGNNVTDHWLISPELPGIEQEISFYMRAITSQYGEETFEVLASSTDNKPESFELVQAFSSDTDEWLQFSATLPEGTKYFAIRHTSVDVFGIMIDNVTFNYSGNLSHYNIYRDGQLIATVEGDVTTYTAAIEDIEAGECTFGVTAVYANGQESQPAVVTINVVTSISQISAGGAPVDIYTVDGKMARRQATTLEGLSGVYVVNGNKVMIK